MRLLPRFGNRCRGNIIHAHHQQHLVFIALIGLVLAIVAMVGIRKGKNSGKGIAIAGLVLSIVAGVMVLGTQAFYSAVLDEAMDQSTRQLNRKMTGIILVDVEVTIGDYSISK